MTRRVYRFVTSASLGFEMSAPRDASGGRVEHWEELGIALQAGAFTAPALIAFRAWRRHGSLVAARLAASFGVLAAVALLFWLLPEEGWQHWAGICVGLVLVLYPLTVVSRLWTARKGLGAVARWRVRMLSIGAALATAFVLVGGIVDASRHPAVGLSTQILSIMATLIVVLGFAPPAIVRSAWRRGEEATLRKGELELMKAVTPAAVASSMLGPIAQMLGGDAALLAGSSGRVIAAHGLDDDDAADTAKRVVAMPVTEPSFHGGMLVLPLRAGWLVVHASPYAPLFGNDEIALVRRLGSVIDMALERAESFQQDWAAREAVERAHAEMESLLYTVSHDLKSPLLTVLGYLDLLRSEGAIPEGQPAHFIERMEASALYMQQLINDLLELSRIGRHDPSPEDVDLTALVADVADELSSRHPSTYVGIGLLPVVTMSAVRARQLVTNLLDNAAMHSGRGDVTVEVGGQRRPDGGARLWVADDGQGVPAQHRERVFGVFERLDDRSTGAGTGIGLAACRKVVEQLGGSIRFADVQRGSCVEIVLPARVVRWQPSVVAVGR